MNGYYNADLTGNDLNTLQTYYNDHVKRFNKDIEYEADKAKDPNYMGSDFGLHHLKALDLYGALERVLDSWGGGSVDYWMLDQVFISFIKNHPDNAEGTLKLFATLIEVVAKILEHRAFIDKQLVWHTEMARIADIHEFKLTGRAGAA